MNSWIFQGNPDQFDIDTYLERTRIITWTVRQKHFAKDMSPGDRVFLWRASGKKKRVAGVIASGWLIEEPQDRLDDSSSDDLWHVKPKSTEQLRVQIRIDKIASPREVIQAKWLQDDPVLRDLLILRLHVGTNYILKSEESERLSNLWGNTGRNWNRSESIAGLWAYHQTYNGTVSRRVESPVAIVSERIGRAVTGVYNKVMNFRAIDPRDKRKGLTGWSATDYAVWTEFYDSQSREIQAKNLDAEFNQLWPDANIAQPEGITVEEATTASTSRGGQGFISDPATRKAVEEHAMKRAEEFYRKCSFEVKNTANTKPYDFRCTKGTLEVRVEVKGSTGGASEVKLTTGEVKNALGKNYRTDLFIVSEIRVVHTQDGPRAEGGTERVIENWKPDSDDLTPTIYRYRVPEEQISLEGENP